MKALKKLKNLDIKLLIMDVDGVLTDGKLYYSDSGIETKCFNVKDGYGLQLLLNHKIEIAIISGRKSKATAKRMQSLGIKHVYLGIKDKTKPYNQIKKELRLKNENIAYIGDDLPDISVMRQVGFSIAVADSVPEICALAHYTTTLKGGDGAVREACDLILNSKC
ncbi:MAG: HAD-IIIA family hydrolase [Gammaproteobacteria bacterium]|nr:HAD-IIIA family hydrolase [Gammaproteobacteria bacterium]